MGVDVNVAARLADEASGGELLVSDIVAEQLEEKGGYEVSGDAASR